MSATMTKKRMRSDYRTAPRDTETAFIDYLMGAYLRGHDWIPDRLPSGLMYLHRGARNASGYVHLAGGKPEMASQFVRFLDGKFRPERGVTHAQVKAAIDQARQDDPEAIAVLDLRQGRIKQSPVAFMVANNIASPSTLTRRFYKAVRLVLVNLIDAWEQGG